MPYPNEHSARLKNSGQYDSFRRTAGKETSLPGSGTIKVPKTIDIIWGIKERENQDDLVEAQALRFPIKNWTKEKALKWLNDNKVTYIKFEPAENTKSMAKAQTENTAKPLVFMMPFFSFTAEEFIDKLNEVGDDQDITVWLNSPGGSVFAGWSVVSALEKKTGNKRVEVMGNASSMAFYMTLFFNEVVAFDVSTFMIHRASGFAESKEEQEFLRGVNTKLREKLEARIDEAKLKEIKNVTLDDIFDGESRIDVFLTAEQAKEIGLVSSIERIDTKEMNAMTEKFVAFYDSEPGARGSASTPQGSGENTGQTKASDNNNSNQKNENKMTKEELKAQHPDIYKAIYEEGVQDERDRVEALSEYVDVDPESVKSMISEGKEPTRKFYAEMNKKIQASNYKEAAKKESEGELNAGGDDDKEPGKSDEEKQYDALKNETEKDVFGESKKQED